VYSIPVLGPPLAVKAYLVLYNLASTAGWASVLYLAVQHLSAPSSTIERLSTRVPAIIPPSVAPLYERATTTYAALGEHTKWVQTGAALEVLHSLLGFVRSPVQTTAMQVASRLYLVWGIADRFTEVCHTFSFNLRLFILDRHKIRLYMLRWSYLGLSLKSFDIRSTPSGCLALNLASSSGYGIPPSTSYTLPERVRKRLCASLRSHLTSPSPSGIYLRSAVASYSCSGGQVGLSTSHLHA